MRALNAIVLVITMVTCVSSAGEARSYSRIRYAGLRHTASNGGGYIGGHGSSHRWGHYRNYRTGNHYGCHRC